MKRRELGGAILIDDVIATVRMSIPLRHFRSLPVSLLSAEAS
jgi:hypothetical protein